MVSKRLGLWTRINDVLSQNRSMHTFSKMEDIHRDRPSRLQLGVENDLETGFQTLLHLMKNPELAGDVDFNIMRCLWRHCAHLEELDMDAEDNVSWGGIYGNKGSKSTEGIERDEDTEYEELWKGEMDELDMELEAPPPNISLADFPKPRSLSLGVHTLCFLARGINPDYRLNAEAFSLVNTLPASLEQLRLYGKGEEGDPILNSGDHESDLDVDALLENLVAEKKRNARLRMLRPIEGIDPVIPRAKEVLGDADEDHPLLWNP